MRVVVCIASLAFLAFAIVVLMNTFRQGKEDDHRRAVQLAEEGLQEAFNKIGESRDWNTGFSDENEDGGRFSVEFAREESGDSIFIRIVSTGVSGSITRKAEHTLRLHKSGGDSDGLADEDAVTEDIQ